MSWYTAQKNRINEPRMLLSWQQGVVQGTDAAVETVATQLWKESERLNRTVIVAVDGFKAASVGKFASMLGNKLQSNGGHVELWNVTSVFFPPVELNRRVVEYSRPDDPDFGFVFEGRIEDFVDRSLVAETVKRWSSLKEQAGRHRFVICHGMGASSDLWSHELDRTVYLDLTREQVIRRAEAREVTPLGSDEKEGFPWRKIYYVEYPALNRHKKSVLARVDWYVDSCDDTKLLLIPAQVYHALMVELSGMPVCFKVFYMPGTFGGTELAHRFGVEGLPNTSWDYEVSVGDNHMLVDVGLGRTAEIPFYNLIMEQPLRVLGSYSHKRYPDHFPIAIYMQDGYFPPGDRSEFKRTHMPHHLHPDSSYTRQNFNEPIGRYETYYIVRADPGAVTMHGFRDDADIDEYIKKVKEAAGTGQEFDWHPYVYEHPSTTGELHQLPPGTVHGTGGRQMILEVDTNPSRESTEYSFYLYDYCRKSFNYTTNTLDAPPVRLQLEHSLKQMRRHRRQEFMAKNCRAAPVCIRSGTDWKEVSFPMYFNMPYQVNRLEFRSTIHDDTRDMFHCLSLTRGTSVLVQSQQTLSQFFRLEDCDSIVVPASFGPYVCVNLTADPCEIIKTTLITEERSHIDKQAEEEIIGSE